jgi:5-methylcytosine-specific restriction enzyme A
MSDTAVCSLCGRSVPRQIITDHHLIPREEGGMAEHRIPMCRPCHGHLHAIYDNKTLAAAFSTIDSLRRDPQVKKFVKFIRKQDPAARFRSAMAAHRPKRKRR